MMITPRPSLLAPLAMVLLHGATNATAASASSAQVSFVLEPFEMIMTDATSSTEYSPGNVTFTMLGDAINKVSTTNDSLFGNGALEVSMSASGNQSGWSNTLTWVIPEDQAAFNCWGANHLSLWYKIPKEQHDASVEMTVTVLDDSACSRSTTGCTSTQDLVLHTSEPFSLAYNIDNDDEWKELTLEFSSVMPELRLDHMRGWGFTFDTTSSNNNTMTTATEILIDQLACVGGGELVGAPFHFNKDSAHDAFEEATASYLWEEEYFQSELSKNLSSVELTTDGFLNVNYTIEQTESWGGFLVFGHVAPGNSYYNLSMANELSMDYTVTEPCSEPGRAHVRLILYDASDCPSDCANEDVKNLEVYYSFNYILDEVTKSQDSISVMLEGTDDPSSPLWMTGWVGSAHDKVFDASFIKGYAIELSMDSQGNISSLVSGSVAVGELVALDVDYNEVLQDEDADTNVPEDAYVSFVLEPFELPYELVEQEVYGETEEDPVLLEYEYSPGNVTFTYSDESGLTLASSTDALFGNGALHILIDDTAAEETTDLSWLVNDDEPAFNCWGATHLSLWYKVLSASGDTQATVNFFDDSQCAQNCSELTNVLTYSSDPTSLGSTGNWQNLKLYLPDIQGLNLDHLRGWGLSITTSKSTTTNSTLDILIDQVACIGGGDLAGAPFHFNKNDMANAFDQATASNLWVANYYKSPLSENETDVALVNGYLDVNYTVQQTETWGGFVVFDHIAPANSYYNLSQASELSMEYHVAEAASSQGRAHLRLILLDGSDCPFGCSNDHEGIKNLEVYYSFHHILDQVASDSLNVVLEGTDDPSSPLWMTGWVGTVHDRVFDPSVVKGYSVEISMDSQGNISSLVSGSVAFGQLTAVQGGGGSETKAVANMVIENDLLFVDEGLDTFTKVEFQTMEVCMDLCRDTPECLYGFSNDRDCYMAAYLTPTEVGIPSSSFHQQTYTSFWANETVRRGDFCEVCDCRESDQVIDCNGKDLVTVPATFTPDPQGTWMPKVVDLGQNPRLLVVGSGSLAAVASEELEEVVLPENLLYIAYASVNELPVNTRVVSAGNDALSHSVKNAISDSSGFFNHVCCGMGNQTKGLGFCDMQADKPGTDSLYLPFTQFLHASITETLTPGSEFGAEASESPEKCAQYCSLFPQCNYFSYDARYAEAEHTCFLLEDNGTESSFVCCAEFDFADLAQTEPGWTSGIAPRTRHELHNAEVNVSPTSLRADVGNDFIVEFDVSLGAMPLRGAVWIEPSIASATTLEYTLLPERIALYDNVTTAVVTLQIHNPQTVAGVGETLVITNHLASCDTAFTALGTEASSVYVQVLVEDDSDNDFGVVLGISLTVLVVVLLLAFYVIIDRRRLVKRSAKNNDLEEAERDEVMEVERLNYKDNLRVDIGRGIMVALVVVAGVCMTVWINQLLNDATSTDSVDSASQAAVAAEDGSNGRSSDAYVYVLGVVFILLLVTFVTYDWFVRTRNRKLVLNSAKSNEIMTTMFPQGIREKLLNETRTNRKAIKDQKKGDEPEENETVLAELYPNTTVCFMDICGFTAWSSSRQPHQVFQLLETVFGAFDKLAKRNKVYKVETVGDAYVSITGAPTDQRDHTIRMCHFASLCIKRFSVLSRSLVVSLGPDTGELELRAGINSGQVTMGVLRNERARYQLFGDCVNTAARMESTGQAGRVQISMETAEQLRNAGRGAWVLSRDDRVVAKGKGMLKTFWLDTEAARKADYLEDAGSSTCYDDSRRSLDEQVASHARLVEWNAEQLLGLLKKIVAFRRGDSQDNVLQSGVTDRPVDTFSLKKDHTYLDEVAEIIQLPQSNGVDIETIDVGGVTISPTVVREVRSLVKNIASMYNDNPFHNFEHASHVTMSIIKLLSRIVKPSGRERSLDMSLHDHSYGITSDPLTHFAVAFCGLIHDADHPGVPNTQLIKEDPILGARFEERSVAEQNSLKQCFDLITKEDYSNLREVLFASNEDQERFRQLVVNTVMATDIVDKDLKALRNDRWKAAFADPPLEELPELTVNRKATIVIEHLIQASDVSHTMQHWNVYRKWNERLLQEMYIAYKEGRSATDPTVNWAKGEIGFFDFYIIPLAKKLKDCGVFGVSSDEYLNYAMINRRKWEVEGESITTEMVARLKETTTTTPLLLEQGNKSNDTIMMTLPPMGAIDEDHSVQHANEDLADSSTSSSTDSMAEDSGHVANVVCVEV